MIVLHYGGYACDLDAVLEIADRRRVAVIEDAAHAPGATLRGQALGTFGAIGCFSFFSNKNLPVGEGGMVVTSDDGLAERLGLLRSHGMTTLTWQRHSGHASTYDVLEPGFNYRMDEIRAALGTVQLERLPEVNRRGLDTRCAIESSSTGEGACRFRSRAKRTAARLRTTSPSCSCRLASRAMVYGGSCTRSGFRPAFTIRRFTGFVRMRTQERADLFR